MFSHGKVFLGFQFFMMETSVVTGDLLLSPNSNQSFATYGKSQLYPFAGTSTKGRVFAVFWWKLYVTGIPSWRRMESRQPSPQSTIVAVIIIIIINYHHHHLHHGEPPTKSPQFTTIIMVTQLIPTMTDSHHGGFLSVMIMVGICHPQRSESSHLLRM